MSTTTRFPARRITVIAMMTALIAICSWITVPYTAVPFTLQTFAVFFALLLLGGKDGTIAVATYILLGAIGVPVFSGFGGGIGHILGLTGGYIVGFLFSTVSYMVFEPWMKNDKKRQIPVLVLGLLLCYLVGTVWFKAVSGMKGISYSFLKILTLCVFPYIVPDLVKMALAFLLADHLKRALPAGFFSSTPSEKTEEKKENDN